MARILLISKNPRFGPVDRQREMTGDCDVEHTDPDQAIQLRALRRGDVLAVVHPRILGKLAAREKRLAKIGEAGALVSIAGAAPVAVDTPDGRARVHELAKAPLRRGTAAQKAKAGRPAQFPKADEIKPEHMALLRSLWAGVMHWSDVAASARELLGCGPVSKPKLYEWLGKRPANPDRPRKKRSDAGTKRTA